LGGHLERKLSFASRDQYSEILEELRSELGYSDCLGAALQRYRLKANERSRLLLISRLSSDHPLSDRLYPGALDAIRHVGTAGPMVMPSWTPIRLLRRAE
jgi:hypothetical protein